MDMERIRELAREQGVDLQVQGLVCLPQEIKNKMALFQSIKRRVV